MRGPQDTHRTMILGRTGSGKSFFACHLLSGQNFQEIPWVIIDYKRDELIADIVRQNKVKVLKVTDKPPTKPGLYIMHPRPILDDIDLEAFMMRCYNQEQIGIYIDEGFALPDKGTAFTLILTQGRSKHIPVICLYQRPVYMNRFVTAQTDFFAVFDQNDERDLKTTQQFIKPAYTRGGQKITVFTPLPKFHCLWYDVGEGRTSVLSPTPGRQAILSSFKSRLSKQPANRQRTLA